MNGHSRRPGRKIPEVLTKEEQVGLLRQPAISPSASSPAARPPSG